jgi:NAD(P) transhydrogenase
MTDFDVLVIGCGPAGERAAIHAARAGKSVAVIERAQVVGGTSVNWGTIPSKTLRESALLIHRLTARAGLEGFRFQKPEAITVSDFMYRERAVVQRELELINETLDRNQIEVFHGTARFIDERSVAVVGVDGQSRMRLRADVIVIAVGTTPNRPKDVPFDGDVIFDSDSILRMPRMPRSMLVLGAGVIGVEYAAIFAALGIDVTLVDTREALLPYMDREIATILERELRRIGIVVIHGDRHSSIERVEGETPYVRCTTRAGNLLEADVMLYSVGRDGTPKSSASKKSVSSRRLAACSRSTSIFRPAHEHIYAVGDVIGYPALASTSMEQGRQAISNALKLDRPAIKTDLLPFAIYSLPEVSYIGETEEALKEKGIPYVVGRGRYALNPRGQIISDTGGMLKLVFHSETSELLGVHIVGHNASELIHIGQVMLRTGCTALQIAEQPFNYPTLSDLYRHAAHRALRALQQRER